MTSIIKISTLIAILAVSLILIFSSASSNALLVIKTILGISGLYLFAGLYARWKSDRWITRYDCWTSSEDYDDYFRD